MEAADRHDHGHDHGHEHGHEHAHAHAGADVPAPSAPAASGGFTPSEAKQARRLKMVLCLVGAFFVLELLGALWAESVVLQADALHLLMDVLALAVSLLAMRLAVRRPTPRFTYGLRRAEPVAAIFSALLVLGTTVGIVVEGVDALHGRASPRAGIMLAVALMALVVNGLSAWLLHDAIGHAHPHPHDADNPDDHGPEEAAHAAGHDHADDHASHRHGKSHGHALNLRGAWLHLMGDALGAIAAICAALVIRYGGSPTADPIASFVVAAILLLGSLRLLRDATLVLLESAPASLPLSKIRGFILGSPGVLALHDLHVWTLGAGHEALTVHVRTNDADPAFGQKLSERIRRRLMLEYVTVQVECEDGACGAPASTWEP
ncbi:MAG TPA: cation diffusion facilitator family transporter [Polyangiaceae bacterium]|nr:cation diffusion facilitator family transporter [Polyangiaceae bacterium]